MEGPEAQLTYAQNLKGTTEVEPPENGKRSKCNIKLNSCVT